jgi:hypothetical protein
LRCGVGGLLALVLGLPFVALLPQVFVSAS